MVKRAGEPPIFGVGAGTAGCPCRPCEEGRTQHSDGGGVAAMCMGGIDPKYGLRDLETQFVARREIVINQQDTNREPTPGLLGWAFALIARFRQKDASHV